MPKLLSQEQLALMLRDVTKQTYQGSTVSRRNEFISGFNRLQSLGLVLTTEILESIMHMEYTLNLELDLSNLFSSQLEQCDPDTLSKFILCTLKKEIHPNNMINIKNFINTCFHHGANVHYRDEKGNTLLHKVMRKPLTELSETLIGFLLAQQVDIHAKNKNTQTAYQSGDYSVKVCYLDALDNYQRLLDFQLKRNQLNSLLESSIQHHFEEPDAVPLCAISIIALNLFGNAGWVKDAVALKNESILERTGTYSKLLPLSIFNHEPANSQTQELEQGQIKP